MSFPPPESGQAVDPFKAGSTRYMDVGAALRKANARARELRLNGTVWRVFSVVIDLTATRSKLQDRTWCGFIAAEAGFGSSEEQIKRARRTLRRLRELGLIEYTGGSRKGRRWTVVGLPPAEAGDETNLPT